MSEETQMQNYGFKVVGKVFAGSPDHARHLVYWALENGDTEADILLKTVTLEGDED
jgi:hypothetical protein